MTALGSFPEPRPLLCLLVVLCLLIFHALFCSCSFESHTSPESHHTPPSPHSPPFHLSLSHGARITSRCSICSFSSPFDFAASFCLPSPSPLSPLFQSKETTSTGNLKEDILHLDEKSDQEIVQLVESGRVPLHALEYRLSDLDRAVKIRRLIVLGLLSLLSLPPLVSSSRLFRFAPPPRP